MNITVEMLREKNACSGGMSWVKNLPNGAEYREFIEKLEADGKDEWATWLIGNFEVLILAEKWRIDSIISAAKGKALSKENSAQIGSSGDSAKIGSSGDYAQIEATGKNSIIAAVGGDSKAKAGENGCIALAWWDEKAKRPRVTVGYVGEEGIEADTWYRVGKNGKLEVTA
jgi:hypothetical protein